MSFRCIKSVLFEVISRSNNFYSDSPFLIFSDPRGGSTWLTELISEIPGTAVIWEPLNMAQKSRFSVEFNSCWRQFIPEEEVWPEARKIFEDLFKGKIINDTTIAHERRTLYNFLLAKNLIIKFVNGNALLPWLCNNFNFKRLPVFLIRHPYAVISSQLEHGAWDKVNNQYTIPDCKFNCHIIEHEDFLSSIKYIEEKLAAEWCLTNIPTLRSAGNNNKWITVNYENLLVQPELELNKIFNVWNLEIPQIIRNRINLPSWTSKGNTSVTAKERLSKWRDTLNSEQKNRINRVLSYFKVEFYGESEVMPLIHF